MRSVIVIFILLFLNAASAINKCGYWTKLGKDLDSSPKGIKEFLSKTENRKPERDRNGNPIRNNEYDFNGVRLESFEQARNIAMNLPALKQMGLDVNDVSRRRPFIANHETAISTNGKPVGYEVKLDDGSWGRVRLDWDKEKGSHFNIEVTKDGKRHKAAVLFNCNGRPCSEAEVSRLAAQMGH
jgi:hypothetical protein